MEFFPILDLFFEKKKVKPKFKKAIAIRTILKSKKGITRTKIILVYLWGEIIAI